MAAARTVLRRVVLPVLLVALVAAAPVVAQEATEPSGTLTSADITIDVGDDTQVTAQYSITFSETGSGENTLSQITGTLWAFPGHVPENFSATVNGQSVEPNVTQYDRYIELGVPVSDVSDGDTVTVTLTYTVPDAAGTVKPPLWVPNYQTGGLNRVIDLEVALPSGAQPDGAVFPKIDNTSNDGTVLHANLLHLPGFVYVQYAGSGSLLALDTVLTVGGVVFLIVFFTAWVYYTGGLQNEGDSHGT